MAPGGWRHPKDRSDRYLDSKHWTDLAALLEQGKVDGLFLADVLGTYDVFISVSPRHSGHRSCIKRALRVAEKNLPPTCGVRLCLRPVESHCQKLLRDLRRSAAKRRRGSILIFVMFTIIVAPTDDEAAAKFEEYRSYVDYEGALALMSGWTGVDLSQYRPDQELRAMETNANQSALESFTLSDPNRHWTIREIAEFVGIGGRGPVVVGSPGTVADELQRWVEETDVDGFNLAYVVMPETYQDIVDLLIPELQRRGVYKKEYRPGTLREKLFRQGPYLPETHPGSSHALSSPGRQAGK
jgi:alkanesulfonate monooxygenase SsuD/methylene tetrahydromethanopterin reductase-like flavin-dependent oxidoreductase (luciferase family)